MMSSYKCKTCGAPLQVTAFSSTALCEFCGATTDLQRDNLQRVESGASSISPEEYKKQIDRAASSYEEGFYDKAFEILDNLKPYTKKEINFNTLYAIYFIVSKIDSSIGERGQISQSWEADCDHSGSGYYDKYACPDFDEIFHEFELLLDDCEELIPSGDQETSHIYALQITNALDEVRAISHKAIDNFLNNYTYTVEEKTRNVKVGDRWVRQDYNEYDKNDQAEDVVTELARDTTKFYSKCYIRLIHSQRLEPHEVDYLPIYGYLKFYIGDKDVPHCTFKKIAFAEELKSEVVDLIESFYDFHLLKNPQATHPLGSAIDFRKLCDYTSEIKEFAQKYIDQGLIASSLVESFMQNSEETRQDALAIQRIYKVGFVISLPISVILAVSASIPWAGAGIGMFIGCSGATLYGRLMTNEVHKQLKAMALISERSIRAEAIKKRFAKRKQQSA